ncbi:porin family protein [Phyllobacterium sp. SB3]|uniref:outer membrane protein n=1 Tax=Phyllobacterium sp. SB3 TaxID=3156073 RepID=UPI0032AF47BF
MNYASRYILAGVLALPFIGSALAADAVDMVPVEEVVIDNGSGFYIGSLSAATFSDDTEFGVAGGLVNVNSEYDVGYYSALRAGYNFGRMGFVSPRLELEVGYGTASIDEHSADGVDFDSIDSYGDARTIQGFVNGYIDIPLSAPGDNGFLSAVTPYIGGGVGVMNLELSRQGVGGVGTLIDDDDTKFAYHVDAGLGFNLQKIGVFSGSSLFENTTLDIGYRYTAADDFDFTARDGTKSSTDFSSNAVTIGFRKQF